MKHNKYIQSVLDNYLKLSNPYIPEESLFLALIMQVSTMLCFNRVKIVNEELDYDTFPNVYALNFMDSGEGKDKPLNDIRKCTEFFDLEKSTLSVMYKETKKQEIEDHIKEESLTGADAREYKKTHAPLFLRFSTGDGTVEGFLKARAALADAGFGSIHFGNSEFVDYIETTNESRKYLISYLIDVYDNGLFKTKLIKSDNTQESNDSIPQTFIGHSSVSDFLENDVANKTLKKFLNSGLGRRCFISYPKKGLKPERECKEKRRERIAKVIESKKAVEKLFKLFWDNIKIYDTELYTAGGLPTLTRNNRTITIEDELVDIILDYKEDMKIASHDIEEEAIRAEMKNREWRTVKLAACITAFTTKDLVIRKEHWESAVSITTYFAEQFECFFKEKIQNNNGYGQKIVEYILNNGASNRTVLRKLIKCKNEYKTQALKNALEEAKEYCNDNNLLFVEITDGSKLEYNVEPKPEHQFVEGDPIINLSIGKTNDPKNTVFEPKQIQFSKIHEVVTDPNHSYSATIFKDNKRCQANKINEDDFIALDIDDTLSIDEAKKRFKDMKYFMCTTRSHGIPKGDKPACDRFRLIFPLASQLPNDKKLQERIVGNMDIPGVDASCIGDTARLYFGAPGEYHYNEGITMNWKVYDYEKKKEEVYSNSNKEYKNTQGLDRNTTIETKNGAYPLDYFETLKPGETAVPCKCPFPGHGDENASAFVKRSDRGSHGLFVHCKGCNITKFINT